MSHKERLNYEEQLLLRDIFQVRIYQDSLESNLTFLPNFAKDLQGQTTNISLLENETLFDSLIYERIWMKDTNVFGYLYECYLRAKEEKGKAWNIDNPKNQQFIDYSIKIIKNFATLFCNNSTDFPDKAPEPEFDSITDPIEYTAKRIMNLMDYGVDDDFIDGMISGFDNEDDQDNLREKILEYVLRKQRERTIIDEGAIPGLQMIWKLLNNEKFKKKFFKMKNFLWIPGPGGINLTKGVGSAMGNLMENSSPLGILMRPSLLLPLIESPKDQDKYAKILDRVSEQLNQRMKKSLFEKLLKDFQNLQREYTKILSDIFKLLLKPNKEFDYKNEIMRWLSALIVGNLSRGKLGLRLQKQNKALVYNSSDSLSLNAYDLMLEICEKFLDRESNMLSKIDPSYYIYGWRFDYNETGIINKKDVIFMDKEDLSNKSTEYGTVTEYFFHTLELSHYCYIPILQFFVETIELIQRLDKEKNMFDPNSHQFKQIEKELKHQEKLFLTYKTLLFDETRIFQTAALYDTFIYLLLRWNGVDTRILKPGDKKINMELKSFMKNIPEHLLTDLFEFHFTYLRMKENYAKMLIQHNKKGYNYVDNLLSFTIICLLNDDFVSNPYTKAKLVELISFFNNEEQEMSLILHNNTLAQIHLVPTLVKFYIDIEFTGASYQFYAKYEYRHYCFGIFKSIWKMDTYKNSLLLDTPADLLERFVNMIMNDTTYCMDEGIDKLEKIMKLEEKIESGSPLNDEEKKNKDQFEGIARSVFLQAREGLELMSIISTFAPKVFYFGDFKKRVAGLLNYFLVELMKPKLVAFKKIADNLKFKQSKFLRDVILTYSNLSSDKEFCEEVTKDERSYKPEEMRKALKRIRNERSVDEQTLSRFEELISQTEKIQVEVQDLTSKLGEIPDEFIDPVTCDLMRDPVLLPTSNVIMERSSIKQQLLNKEEDPFNRKPLKLSDLKELPDFKKKIEDWIQSKLNPKKEEEEGKINTVEEQISGQKSDEMEQSYNQRFYKKDY